MGARGLGPRGGPLIEQASGCAPAARCGRPLATRSRTSALAPLALWLAAIPRLGDAPGAASSGHARRPSTGARRRRARRHLGDRGAAIVSGGAVGIDAAAHRAALASDALTISVLAGGLDRTRPGTSGSSRGSPPTASSSLGALGGPPTRWRFLNRNRVITALTGATVVVEAGRRSGTPTRRTRRRSRPLGPCPARSGASSAGYHRLRASTTRPASPGSRTRSSSGSPTPLGRRRSHVSADADPPSTPSACGPHAPRARGDPARGSRSRHTLARIGALRCSARCGRRGMGDGFGCG